MKIAWFVIAVVLVVVGLVFHYYTTKKRRAACAAWAAQHGWEYVRRDDSYADYYQGTPFNHGDHRRVTNLLRGQLEGRDALAFDYSYQTHQESSKGGRRTETHKFSIVATTLRAPLPTLEVAREDLFTSIGRMIGIHDIELESEDFNKEFKIKAQDRKFAYDVLNPRTMEYLLKRQGPEWRIEGCHLISWRHGQLDLGAMDRRLEFLTSLSAGIPDFVWEVHSGPGTPAP